MTGKLQEAFGNIDIYLFDQLLKGRYDDCKKIIDIGCGSGRNIVYFLKNGFEVFGIDPDADAVNAVREMAGMIAPGTPPENFIVARAEEMPFPAATFDLAICSAVLHFARNEAHFNNMLRSIWNILKPGGFLFARLASDIGIEHLVESVGNSRYLLPDGTTRLLVNEQTLLDYTQRLNGTLYEPIKTTNVSNLRCMTTWCMQKKQSAAS